MSRDAQIRAFLQASGWDDARCSALAGDASNRRYERLTSSQGGTAILMDAPPATGEDVRPFVQVARYLEDAGLSAPRIFAQDAAQGFLLLEDLGDDLFHSLIAKNPMLETDLYYAANDVLLHLRNQPAPSLPRLDTHWLISATELFFDWYAPQSGDAARSTFSRTFRQLASALKAVPPVFVFRDFHAQNLLWLPDRSGVRRVGLLDFQDALVGHPAYDLVSMLQDARRDVSPEMEDTILRSYLSHSGDPPQDFRQAYALLGLQRNLRILGIFARLCLRDGKVGYVDLIPRVHGYFRRNLAHPGMKVLRPCLDPLLPEPTPLFLNELKARCATPPQP